MIQTVEDGSNTVLHVFFTTYSSKLNPRCLLLQGSHTTIDHCMKAESHTEHLLDELPDGIIVSDNTTRVLYVNKAAEDIFKIPIEQLKQMVMRERVHPDDRMNVQRYARLLRTKKSMRTKRRFKNGEGKYVFIERTTRLLDNGNQLSICRDVTEEEEFRYMTDMFVSIAGHELRNPLSSIQIHTDLLSSIINNSEISGQATPILHTIDDQIDRQSALINDLLEISRIKKGKLVLRMDWFDPRKLVEEMVFQVRMTTGRAINIVEMDKGTDLVYGDKDRLYQVGMNLLLNAAKFSAQPSPIEMGLIRESAAWKFWVADHGIGIEKRKIRDIFVEFRQIEKTALAGLGLGLFLAYEIVRQHGGTIEVQSELKKGSTFSVFLPLVPREGMHEIMDAGSIW